jgi:hypothetical protein
MNVEKLGTGIVLFQNVIKMEEYPEVIPFIKSLKQKAVEEDYTIIKNDLNESIYAINRSGHRYALEDIEKSSSHIMNFLDNNNSDKIELFFTECEKAFRQCLLQYLEMYPMALPSIWWRTQGHVLAYGPGSDMGLHSDNDVNYQPGFEPDLQVATRSVLGSILYFNTSVDSKKEIIKDEYLGGHIVFPYCGVEYSPKAGDLLMFPSNFIATHEVKACHEGGRYAYIGYYSHGSEHVERGINLINGNLPVGKQGQIWMPEIVEEYKQYIHDKYPNEPEDFYGDLLQPTRRMYNSANTLKEVDHEIQ